MLPGFDVCGECDDGLDYPTPSFSESHPLPVPCPSCSGVGSVPNDATVEATARAIASEFAEDVDESHLDGARAALVAYARLVKEEA